MSEISLKQKTTKGLAWSAIDNFGGQIIHFLFSIIVARLLSPEAYGIVAMPMIFIAISQCFITSGFGNALIRKQDLKEEDLSTAFFFNIGVGLFFYLLLFISSPWIADFYSEPILTSLLKITALSLLFNPLCTVQQALLTRDIDFKRQAIITFSASIISGIVGIVMAYQGYGVWALVFQQTATYVIRTILLWTTSKWYPKTGWSNESFKYLWSYGSRMLASALLNTGYENFSSLVIGKFYTSADLGNYTRALHFTNLPSQSLTQILKRVSFPVLSTIQDDDERLRHIYRKMIRMSCFVIFPIMLILAALSKPIVLMLLTDKWLGCVFYMEILCFTSMWYPVHLLNLNLLQVKGRPDLFLRLEIIKKIIGFLIMAISLPFGVLYFVLSGLLTSLLSLFINTYYTGKYFQLPFNVQMKDVMPIFVLSIIVWAILHLFIFLIDNVYVQLIAGTLIGIVLYFSGARYFLKKELNDIFDLIPLKIKENSLVKLLIRNQKI